MKLLIWIFGLFRLCSGLGEEQAILDLVYSRMDFEEKVPALCTILLHGLSKRLTENLVMEFKCHQYNSLMSL